eukprot:m.141638 g.141638  ORF g.141638 m.141638 type:complete len:212 (+) comp30201_c1_seq1:271-906(+)
MALQSIALFKINYSQDSISNTFTNGSKVKYSNTSAFPPLEVVSHQRQLYTLNNRYLYALKSRFSDDYKVDVRLARKHDTNFFSKFNTTNGGVSVKIRGHTLSCPVCHDTRFRTMSSAVMHVESGSCSGCLGRDNARQAIYGLAQTRASHAVSGTAMLEYHGGYASSSVPDNPYECAVCNRTFAQFSSWMQHTSDSNCSNTYSSSDHLSLGW